MRVGVVGSRTFPHKAMVVDWMVWEFPEGATCVSGECPTGVDAWAKEIALREGYPYEGIPAEWDKYGKVAGFLRNTALVNRVDRLVAFWDGSPGTRDTIRKAINLGMDVEVHTPSGRVDRWREVDWTVDDPSDKESTTSRTFVEGDRSRPEASPRRTRRSSEPGP